jgi:hypothetical protein
MAKLAFYPEPGKGPIRKALRPANRKLRYPDAFQYAKSIGKRLPAYPILHQAIMGERTPDSLQGKLVCSRHLLAYPKSHGVFPREQDIVDAETGMHIPLSYATKWGDIYQPKIGLLIDPADLEMGRDGRIAVIPQSITILGGEETPFIQQPAIGSDRNPEGKLHKETKVPLLVPHDSVEKPAQGEMLPFCRRFEQSIRPLARYAVGLDARVRAYAYLSILQKYDVFFEEDVRPGKTAANPEKIKVRREPTKDGDSRLVIEGGDRQIDAILGAIAKMWK